MSDDRYSLVYIPTIVSDGIRKKERLYISRSLSVLVNLNCDLSEWCDETDPYYPDFEWDLDDVDDFPVLDERCESELVH